MDYRKVTVQAFDASWSKQYREGDALAITHGSRQHYGDLLRKLSGAFGRPIDVLDVGCGTGRYFHCLRNVRRLVGVDISRDMLEQALEPVHGSELQVEQLELLCGDIYSLELPAGGFDLIYSIGVLAEYSPLTAALLEKLTALLAPRGRLLLTAVDIHSRLQQPEDERLGPALRVVRKIFPALPRAARRVCNRALGSHYLTERQLGALFRNPRFASFALAPYRHSSGWQGVHWDCLAEKH